MAFQLDISKIRSVKGSSETYHEEVDELDFITGDWKLVEPLVYDVKIEHIDRILEMTGTLKTVVQSACARCLKPVFIPIECNFAEQLLYAKDVSLFSHLAFGEVEEKFVIYGKDTTDNDTLDITDIMRETIMAELPLKVLCRDDCRGLCPKCGIDLNQGTCKCDLQEVDPRFAALAKLIESEEV